MKNKTTLSFLLIIALAFISNAQSPKRYYNKVFTNVRIDSNQVYGNNYTYDVTKGQIGLTNEDLTLDIYTPIGDTLKNRPLIIWAHGGSFMGGTKDDKDIVYFCNEFAKRGFVCVSINYRLGFELPIDSIAAVRTVYRALQDGRAAIRYMRSKANNYQIDKDRVYFGGTSAGAFIALNVAFLNSPEEVPSYVDTMPRLEPNTNLRFGLDGIEGLTNTIEESSSIHGIINFCGATKTTNWMDDTYSRNIPIISMHGTQDGTVPYGTRTIFLNDLTPIPEQVPLPIIPVQGSYDIDRHADKMGYASKFYTWYGADHVPYIDYDTNPTAAAYMDTLMRFTVKHVYEDFLGLGTVDGLEENTPPCDFNNGDTLPCLTAIKDKVARLQNILPFPNPCTDSFSLENNTGKELSISIKSLLGQTVLEHQSAEKLINVITTGIPSGLYLLQIDHKKASHKIRIQH